MEENKVTATAPAKKAKEAEKLVKIKLPRVKGEDAVFVSVNERTWLVKRGIEVEVPECVEEVLRHQEEMQEQAEAFDNGVKK